MTERPGTAGRSPVPGLAVRAIRPDDAPALQAFHQRLSPDTVRRRFFGPHPRLPDEEAHRFTALTAGKEVALVAVIDDQIVGVVRYVRIGSSNAAEVAFVVQDGYQGHGLGRVLLSLLARIGWDDGIRRFVADTLAHNHAMLSVFRRTPQAVTVAETRRDGDVVHLSMPVTPPRSDMIGTEGRATR